MRQAKDFLVNTIQVLFWFFWSFFVSVLGLVFLLVTWKQETALWLATKIWGPSMVWISGCKLDVQGLENVDFSKPHIFAMNHLSSFDIPIAFRILPVYLRFVAKEELRWVPFMGWYMWAVGMIFVNRKKSKQAIASLKKAGKLIREGRNIIAFPEGSRSDDGTIKPFKKGIFIVAIEAGVPIVPIAIEGSQHVLPKNSWKIFQHDVKVTIGKPISTQEYTQDDRDLLIEKVRGEMVRLNLSIGGLGASEQPNFSQETLPAVQKS